MSRPAVRVDPRPGNLPVIAPSLPTRDPPAVRLEGHRDNRSIHGAGAPQDLGAPKKIELRRPPLEQPLPSPLVNKPALEPAHIRAKLETAIDALSDAATRAGEVAEGNKRAYGKMHSRFRQSARAFNDLSPNDLRTLSSEDREKLGAALGRELHALLHSMPKAIEQLRGEDKNIKADDLASMLSKVLSTFAEKLQELPILPPALEGKDARETVAWLSEHLRSAGELTPDQRMAALYLTDAVAAQLRSALAASGGDSTAVDALRVSSGQQLSKISLFARTAAVLAASAAIVIPVVFGGGGNQAKIDPAKPNGGGATPAVVLPTVDPNEVHRPERIRVTEDRGQQRRQLDAARTEIAQNEGGALPPQTRRTVVDTLDAAGFKPNAETTLEEAVATFQTSVGLEPDGVLDTTTWNHLEESVIIAEGPNGAFSPAQSEGETSSSVRQSEQLLSQLGLLPKERVDGEFDAATTRASQKFEAQHQGYGDDGAIDIEQFRAMARSLAGRLAEKPEVVSRPSPNTTPRGGVDIDTIVLHHTASNDTAGDLATLTSAASEVSAHYLIGRDGTIYQLVPDELQSWHAGESQLRGEPSVNPRSIGIEITNDGLGSTPFTDRQYEALRALVPHLVAKYDIPIENIVGHKEIAIPAGRKSDPAANFEEGRVLAAVERLTELEQMG